MSSHSRAASAGSSRRVKQELVRLLFGPQYSGNGRDAHRKLDHSIYSYADLKAEYLKHVQKLHPDKHMSMSSMIAATPKANNESHYSSPLSSSEELREQQKARFAELQDAWNRYENLAKLMRRVESGGTSDASFTMFGVGCSFSDTEAERDLRNEITDQACRGWFTAGLLEESTEEDSSFENSQSPSSHRQTSLLHDDMFVHSDANDESRTNDNRTMNYSNNKSPASETKRSLVSHLIRKRAV